MTLELESKEKQTLTGILLVEQSDLKEVIAKSKDEKDKQELELELVNVDWRAKF